MVKHLLDFKRRVDLPPGAQPFSYRKAESRIRVVADRTGTRAYHDWYHEVVVAKERSSFHHALHTADRETEDALVECFQNKQYDLEAGTGGEWHRIAIEPGKHSTSEFEYIVKVDPPLQPGEVFGYRRCFELPNRFPLTSEEFKSRLEKLQANKDHPSYIFEGRYYGENFNVVYDVDALVFAYHFPKRVKLANKRVVVAEYLDRRVVNRTETARCSGPEFLLHHNEPNGFEQVLELIVPRPLINHCYYLLYEIAQ